MKTLAQDRIDKARDLIREGKGYLVGVDGSINLLDLLNELEELRNGVKELAIAHGVRGASGFMQPSIKETAEHIEQVMLQWKRKAGFQK